LDEKAANDYVFRSCIANSVIFGEAASHSDTCGDPVLARCLAPRQDGCPNSSDWSHVLAAEPYPPVVYAPAWIGYRIGGMTSDPADPLRAARVTQLLTYVALGVLAIRIAPWGKPFFFAIALLPVVMQTASTVSADALTNGMALVAAALTVELVDRGRSGRTASGPRLAALGTAFVLLGMTKPGYGPLALVVAVVPTAAFGSWRRRVAVVGTIVGLVALTNLMWITGVSSHLDAPMRAGTDPVAQAKWVSASPIAFIESVGRTWSDGGESAFIAKGAVVPESRLKSQMNISWWMWSATVLGLIGAYVVDMRRVRSRLRTVGRSSAAMPAEPPEPATGSETETVHAAAAPPRVDWWATSVVATISLVLMLVVTYAMALASNPVAPRVVRGIQGRYFLPLLPLCLLISLRPRKDVPVTRALWLPIWCVVLLGWWFHVLWTVYGQGL